MAELSTPRTRERVVGPTLTGGHPHVPLRGEGRARHRRIVRVGDHGFHPDQCLVPDRGQVTDFVMA